MDGQKKRKEIISRDRRDDDDVVTEEVQLESLFQQLIARAELRNTPWEGEPLLWSKLNHKKVFELLSEGKRPHEVREEPIDYEKKLEELISRSEFRIKPRSEVLSAGKRPMLRHRGLMPTLSQQKDDQKKSEETISKTEDMRKEIMSALQQKIRETEQKDTIASRVRVPLLRGSEKKGKEIVSEMLSYLKTMEENEGGTDSMKQEKEEAESEYRKMLGDLTPELEDHVDAYLDDVEEITEDEIDDLCSKMNVIEDQFLFSTSALYGRWIRKGDERFCEDSAKKGLEKYNMERETNYVLGKISQKQCLLLPDSIYHINFIAKSSSTSNENEMFFVESRRSTDMVVTVCRKLEEAVGIYRGCRFCSSRIFHPCGVNLDPRAPLPQPWHSKGR